MRKDKEQALNLRKSGNSYSQIKNRLNIPKSTLSNWLGSLDWSTNIKTSINSQTKKQNTIRILYLNKIRGKQLNKIYKRAQEEAKVEFIYFKYHPLFIAGVVAYWGEGDKVTLYNVRISNIDPNLIKLFIDFLIKICGVEINKIKLSLLIYPDLEEKKCLNYWSNNVNLGRENFIKSTIIQGRHKIKKVSYGICTVTVTSRYLKEKMLIWLKLLPQELISEDYYSRE